MITKEQIMKKLAERKREQAKKARLEAKRKAHLEARRKVVKKPIYSEDLNKDKKVIRETRKTKSEPKTITEAISRRVKGMNKEQEHLYRTLAENMTNAVRTLNEATQAGANTFSVVDQGAGVGLMKTYFDIFFGYFPNLIVPLIASTQPIKTEKAMVFYYQSVAGKAKGNVEAGQTMITPFEINTDINFTSELINLPAVGASTLTYDTDHNNYSSGAIDVWGPVIARSVQMENAVLTWSDDTHFTGTYTDAAGNEIAISSGVVTVSSTQVTVECTFAKDLDGWDPAIEITYSYDNKYAPTQVAELNANVDSRDIVAKARTIKTNYSFQAGFGFEAQFGVKLEDKLAESAMFELKRETDLDFVFTIMREAPVKTVWNKAAGIANGLYEIHKQSFRDAIVSASNYIYKVSKRVRGNVLLVGVNAQSIIETLPEYKGENFGSQLGGPTMIGKLKDIKVIAIPSLGQNDWAVIYKNDKDNLDAGIVFAPYIPVVATTPVTLDDFVIRRAYTMSYGKLVVNPNYFVRGEIVDDPMAAPVYLVSKDGTDTSLGTIGTDALAESADFYPEAV